MNDLQLLGLKSTATVADLRTAYKEKALLYHPDRSTGNAEMFKKVNKAYNALFHVLEAAKETTYNSKNSTTWDGLGADTRAAPTHSPSESTMRPRTNSFMNPTQNSKNSSNPKIGRHTPSTATPKPSTLNPSLLRKRSATMTAAAQPFIRNPVLPVSFQKADLSSVILDVSPHAFSMIDGSHLKFNAIALRRSDGMTGCISGVLPSTGELYWKKSGSTCVAVAPGNAKDYIVAESPHSPAPTPAPKRFADPINVNASSSTRPRCNTISGVFGNVGFEDSVRVESFRNDSEHSPLTPMSSSYTPSPTSPWPLRFPMTSVPVVRPLGRI